MAKFQVALVVACIATAVIAEPPVSEEQYGVPGRFGGGNGAYSNGSGGFGGNTGGYGGSNGDLGYDGMGGHGNNEPANYEFKYDVEDQPSALRFGHEETRRGDLAQGMYYVLLPDGSTQMVEYEADQDGYRPRISYEQPGGYGRGGQPDTTGGYSR